MVFVEGLLSHRDDPMKFATIEYPDMGSDANVHSALYLSRLISAFGINIMANSDVQFLPQLRFPLGAEPPEVIRDFLFHRLEFRQLSSEHECLHILESGTDF